MTPRQEGWIPRMAVPIQDPPRPSEKPQEARSAPGWVRGWVRDLIDRWRHPGESIPMRRYRRWRESTGRGVYVLSTVREISGDPDPFDQMGRILGQQFGRAKSVEEQTRIRIVGARIVDRYVEGRDRET